MKSYLDIPYVERAGHTLSLDLFVPSDQPTQGLMLFVHGGGFARGARQAAPSARLARRLTSMGVGLASVSYRLNTDDLDLPTRERRQVYANRQRAKTCGIQLKDKLMGPRFEAARQDVGAALAFFRDGDSPVNFSAHPIGLIGISAGGMIGLSLAFPSDGLPTYEKPACVVALGATLQHPWTLTQDAPRCLMIHSVKDFIVPPENCEVLKPYAKSAEAPLDIQMCSREGHNAPAQALFSDDAPNGTPYWTMLRNLMRDSDIFNPSLATA
ncbi:hypothetical protein [uncultured Shimia sp.]|uniref:alpha/beta hydrolase n=1 Tax=uncultured Shimia sp. TaxID=573152 RepID=UPI0025F96D88|nr:hypothetical protein [uncultured Shimia sp.]